MTNRQNGFTLLEVAIYTAVLLVVGAPLVSIILTATRSTAENDAFNKVQAANRTAVFRIQREVRNAMSGTLSVQDSGATLQFTSAAGFDGTAVIPGPVIQFSFRPVNGESWNGTDDNGNGLVDEGELVRTDLSTGVQSVLVSGIDFPNSRFTPSGTGVSVAVGTFGSLDKRYGTYGVTNSLTVYPRN